MEPNIQLNKIPNDEIKKHDFKKQKEKKQQMNSGETPKLGLIPQIRNSLNHKLMVNQESQFNVEA